MCVCMYAQLWGCELQRWPVKVVCTKKVSVHSAHNMEYNYINDTNNRNTQNDTTTTITTLVIDSNDDMNKITMR